MFKASLYTSLTVALAISVALPIQLSTFSSVAEAAPASGAARGASRLGQLAGNARVQKGLSNPQAARPVENSFGKFNVRPNQRSAAVAEAAENAPLAIRRMVTRELETSFSRIAAASDAQAVSVAQREMARFANVVTAQATPAQLAGFSAALARVTDASLAAAISQVPQAANNQSQSTVAPVAAAPQVAASNNAATPRSATAEPAQASLLNLAVNMPAELNLVGPAARSCSTGSCELSHGAQQNLAKFLLDRKVTNLARTSSPSNAAVAEAVIASYMTNIGVSTEAEARSNVCQLVQNCPDLFNSWFTATAQRALSCSAI
jgi:cell wall-associated NlpC family hydrolase